MKLIIGLGNIGSEYENTRHNIGFKIIDNYLNGVNFKKNKVGLFYKRDDVIFLKPTTYMNLSGIALKHFMNYYKIDRESILVIYDDVDTKIGKFKIKYQSAAGGHNGIKSIIEHLKSDQFLRIKVGISRPNLMSTSDYVLSNLNEDEMNKINILQNDINNIIDDFIIGNTPEYIMNKHT